MGYPILLLLTRQVGLSRVSWHSRACLMVAERGVEFIRVCAMPCASRLPKPNSSFSLKEMALSLGYFNLEDDTQCELNIDVMLI